MRSEFDISDVTEILWLEGDTVKKISPKLHTTNKRKTYKRIKIEESFQKLCIYTKNVDT